MAAGNAETGSNEPYVGSDGDSASPYDETTGQIPIQQRPADDRDAFYDRHSRGRMTRVDELDDLDPDEVQTRPFSATAPPAGKSAPPAGKSMPPAASSESAAEATGHRRRRRPAPQRIDDAATERFASSEPATPEPAREHGDVAYPVTAASTERHDTAIIDTATPQPEHDAADSATAEPVDPATPEPVDTARFSSARADVDAVPTPVHADHDESLAVAEPRVRRGTLDLGLLLLRVAVGVVVMAHGLSHLFGWWTGTGLDGFQNELLNPANPAIGFAVDAAKPLAAGIALAETIGGLMVIVGLLTPIGSSAILAVMLLAAAFKTTIAGGFEFFASANGVEFELMMAAAAAAIILTGPGLYSLDYPRGWARRPFIGSVLWLVVGIAVACVIWIFCNGTDPFTSPGNPT
ncbi:DoxX family protein [Gordonia sputi]|uniref:DoxX family protein n=1 Tax=Gordonia TaxID=2053 RepID=UPI0007EB776B|nr:DoxX family protein [Gordonia sp. 852002-10350_SCH5691597]MCM3896724.1 DoxX family membrane protein [Gordonia sputi]OBA65609.1 hypothetical protein A5777_20265 [Gordonia sp. 852002-10350_SCH5691597]